MFFPIKSKFSSPTTRQFQPKMVLYSTRNEIPTSLEIKRTTLENMNVNSNINYQIMNKSTPIQFVKQPDPLNNPKMLFPDASIPVSIKKKKIIERKKIEIPYEEKVEYPPTILQLPIPPYITSSTEVIIDSQPSSPGSSRFLYTKNDLWKEKDPPFIPEDIIVPIVEKCLSQLFQDQIEKLSEPLSRDMPDLETPNSVLEELLQPTVARIVQRVFTYDCYYKEKITFIPDKELVLPENEDNVDYDDVYAMEPIINAPIIISLKDNPLYEVDSLSIPSSPVLVEMGDIYNDQTDTLYYNNELRLPAENKDPFDQGSVLDIYYEKQTVYVTGSFEKNSNLTSLDLVNQQWKQIGDGLSHLGTSIIGDGQDILFVGGIFSSVGKGESYCEASNLAAYQISTKKWLSQFEKMGPNSECSCLAYDTTNNKLYIGGSFTKIGDQEIYYIGVYDKITDTWSSLEGGNLNGPCRTLCLDEENQMLYVGGLFTQGPENMSLSYVGAYDLRKHCWNELSGGIQGHCNALCVCLNHVYVGGRFTNVGSGMEVHNIARYDIATKTWSNMSQGVNNVVNCIVYDSKRQVLYVGGSFTSSMETKEILISVGKFRCENEVWESLGVEMEGSCKTLKIGPNKNFLFIGKSGKNAFMQVTL